MDAELVIDHREIIIAHLTAANEMVNTIYNINVVTLRQVITSDR